MASSFDELAKNVSGFKHLCEHVPSSHTSLLLRKGVSPYDYMNYPDKFKETTLPPMQAFYSKLNDSEISSEDYKRAQRVWDAFQINNLGEYADLRKNRRTATSGHL